MDSAAEGYGQVLGKKGLLLEFHLKTKRQTKSGWGGKQVLGSAFRTLAMSEISSGGMPVVLLLGTVPCVYTGSSGPNTDSPIGSTVLFEEMSDCLIRETNRSTSQASKYHQATDHGGRRTELVGCSWENMDPRLAGLLWMLSLGMTQSWGPCLFF